jgi:hypothetical protein
MKGDELCAVTDLQGKPLFFVTEPNDIDFRLIIFRCADMLKGYAIAQPVLEKRRIERDELDCCSHPQESALE